MSRTVRGKLSKLEVDFRVQNVGECQDSDLLALDLGCGRCSCQHPCCSPSEQFPAPHNPSASNQDRAAFKRGVQPSQKRSEQRSVCCGIAQLSRRRIHWYRRQPRRARELGSQQGDAAQEASESLCGPLHLYQAHRPPSRAGEPSLRHACATRCPVLCYGMVLCAGWYSAPLWRYQDVQYKFIIKLHPEVYKWDPNAPTNQTGLAALDLPTCLLLNVRYLRSVL